MTGVEKRSHLKVVEDYVDPERESLDNATPPILVWPDCGCSPTAYSGSSTTIVHMFDCQQWPEGTPLTAEEYLRWDAERNHPAKGTKVPPRTVADPEGYTDAHLDDADDVR